MNIKITHNWLLEYLDTDATPLEIQKFLSLCGPSVERVEKIKNDYVYDIEITSNRVDSASVMGIAREAAAILPRFNKTAHLREKKYIFPGLKLNNEKLIIEDPHKLSKRIMAVIFSGVKIKASPDYIRERLEAVGIRSINNLVDITNYIMVETGHPAHVFDFDRINTGKFTFRQAKKGEKLTTLDKKSFTLYGGEIIIDDGTGRIVDLPSIMGTENSVVTLKSNRIIFFIDNVDPQLVRKASMTHGIRTLAATYNEKGLDPELVKTAFQRGVQLFGENSSPESISRIIDIYPEPAKLNKITVSLDFIKAKIGTEVSTEDILSILKNLQFKVSLNRQSLTVLPPSCRAKDIQIPEDIVEEIARIFGYHNLPNNIQPVVYIKQPKAMELFYEVQTRVKHFLKNLGLHEVMNYSMISEKIIRNSELEVKNHLKLKNSISEDIQYMRSHLLPSLYMNIKNNEGKVEELRFFEIAKTYKNRPGDLPLESYKLGIVINTEFADIKGLVDALLSELNIEKLTVKVSEYPFLRKYLQAEMFIGEDWIVRYGELSKQHRLNYQIRKNVFLAVFDFATLIKYQKPLPQYKPINSFAVIKLDQTFANTTYAVVHKAAEESKLLQKIDFISTYKDKFTLRFYYSAKDRNITEEEAKKELAKI